MPARPRQNPFRQTPGQGRVPRPAVLVLFGSRGDLARRKIVPALGNLARNGLLPQNFAVLGLGREELPDDAYRDEMREALGQDADDPAVAALLEGCFYRKFGASDQEVLPLVERLVEIDRLRGTAGNRLFYLSTPPSVFATIVERIGAYREHADRDDPHHGYRRIIVEKPFGRDLASARALNRTLLDVFAESEVYRIDHYLGKETVQNMLVLRFANAIFEPLWNRRYVDHVQITVAESLGVEGRGGYYEESGALRDMVQNHLMQLLCLVAMEPPAALDAEAIRDERRKVLRSIRPLTEEDVARSAVRGQYGAGSIDGAPVPGYLEEESVDPHSTTETYAALRLEVDNWRWSGVPFFLRTGKRLPRKASEVAIRFKDIPHRLFEDGSEAPGSNVLALRIQPDEGVSLRFDSKVPGFTMRVRPVKMEFQYGTAFGTRPPEAYERLLLDAFLGDPTLFIRGDVAEDAWKLVTPVLEAWRATPPRFPNYAAGTYGPTEADQLVARDGVAWRRP